jgi:hypothetical protein
MSLVVLVKIGSNLNYNPDTYYGSERVYDIIRTMLLRFMKMLM